MLSVWSKNDINIWKFLMLNRGANLHSTNKKKDGDWMDFGKKFFFQMKGSFVEFNIYTAPNLDLVCLEISNGF